MKKQKPKKIIYIDDPELGELRSEEDVELALQELRELTGEDDRDYVSSDENDKNII